jgi:hypothetical protein
VSTGTGHARRDAYMLFLRGAAVIQNGSALEHLDPLEERILRFVAAEVHAGQRLSVRQLMDRREFGSPATIHTRLKAMRSKGWLTLVETDDARRKSVEPTKAARRHFDRLGRCMARVVRAAQTDTSV